ncbi:carbon dioxide-concentrating mechanism protein CcmK [Geitlerinema sp. PCC 9228]|jgi:microcompartment protein CcmL/EutN|uniref:carbon dioxide-concentrating mechanism protein CcmK n=1 Tax=Geitlerinema sp. PCC 9228 TaxID=111611 RepID=UPI0008F994E3|nr:carbon dioxide-concentrating mechanism protein CcmK [Geitlerinema sp. PCC 9228]
MPVAVGVIETMGFPGTLAAADAMVKTARVTVVQYSRAESGHFFVAIRGPVSEVKRAMEAGIEAAEKPYGSEVLTYYMIPNPPENVATVLPVDYTEAAEPFR